MSTLRWLKPNSRRFENTVINQLWETYGSRGLFRDLYLAKTL